MTLMHRPMPIGEISFGVVERKITIGDKTRLRGEELTYGELAAMRTANRNALIENRVISVFPKGVDVRRQQDGAVIVAAPIATDGAVPAGQMHVIAKGFGKWDVIQGTIIASGLTKEAAQELAGKAEPKSAPVNQPAPTATAGPANKRRKRKASPGKRLPAPGENNGPIEG
jgi:hypothetical protein